MTPKHLTLDKVHALGIFCAWTVEIWRRGFRETAAAGPVAVRQSPDSLWTTVPFAPSPKPIVHCAPGAVQPIILTEPVR